MSELIRVRDLRVEFAMPEGVITAVDGVSFSIHQGSTVALVDTGLVVGVGVFEGMAETMLCCVASGVAPEEGHAAAGQAHEEQQGEIVEERLHAQGVAV